MTSDNSAIAVVQGTVGTAAPAAIRRILVVDDSRLQRRLLTGMLRKWGFVTLEAASGEQALRLYRETMPDLVISDWMMPGMDGLTLCRTLRDLSGDDYCYFILLTSKSEKNEIAQGLDAGSDDFLTKPVNPGELRARITAGARIVSMQAELSEKNRVINETLDRLTEAYDKIDQDLMQARKIQDALMPVRRRAFGESQVSLLLKPCGHIGGDLVGMFSPGGERLAFYSIDVSGHGITSAMMTARLGSYLSTEHFDQNVATYLRPDGDYALMQPARVAALLNDRLTADIGIDEYFTMAYATADLRSGIVKLVQAGHPHPMLLRRDGSVEFVGEGGVPVGLVPGVEYRQVIFQMYPGERLLLYSDGFSECRMRDGEMLEQEGLADLVARIEPGRGGQEFLDDLFWHLTEGMCPATGAEDDISATMFEFNGR